MTKRNSYSWNSTFISWFPYFSLSWSCSAIHPLNKLELLNTNPAHFLHSVNKLQIPISFEWQFVARVFWMWNLMLLLRTQEDDENKSNLVNGFKLLKCRMWFRHLKCPWCKYFPKSNNALLRISLCKLVHSIQLIIYLSSLIHNKHLKFIKTSDESYLYKTLRQNVVVHVNWTAHHKHH